MVCRGLIIGGLALALAAPAGAAGPAAGVGVGGPSPECTPRSTPISQAPATLASQTFVPNTGGRLLDLVLHSPAMGRDMHSYVLLPEGFDPTGDTRYPVLYLLHGASGSYKDWISHGAQKLIDGAGVGSFITVMPDAGAFGFYSDWYGTDLVNGQSPPPAWTTYHIGELLPYVDAHFPTLADRQHRAIAGLSMGGFGAMSYAARYPDLFGAAGSFSGAVDTDIYAPAGSTMLSALSPAFTQSTPNFCVWGDAVTNGVNWRTDDPTYLASNLHDTSLFVASGDGNPGEFDDSSQPGTYAAAGVEYMIWPMNQKFAGALTAAGLPFTSYFYGSGTHAWPYWERDLQHFLPQMADEFAHGEPAAPFFYRTASPSFHVYGWSFASDHPATEFTYLSNVRPGGLQAIGSGTLSVTTAPVYAPGSPHTVTVGTTHGLVKTDTTSTTTHAVADAAGRLTFTVALGRGHTTQQTVFGKNPPAGWTHAEVGIAPAH